MKVRSNAIFKRPRLMDKSAEPNSSFSHHSNKCNSTICNFKDWEKKKGPKQIMYSYFLKKGDTKKATMSLDEQVTQLVEHLSNLLSEDEGAAGAVEGSDRRSNHTTITIRQPRKIQENSYW